MPAARESDYVTLARAAVAALWQAMHDLLTMQDEWNALDYGNTLDDGTGNNAGITKSMVGAAVFDTANEIKTRILQTGHATNLAKLL